MGVKSNPFFPQSLRTAAMQPFVGVCQNSDSWLMERGEYKLLTMENGEGEYQNPEALLHALHSAVLLWMGRKVKEQDLNPQNDLPLASNCSLAS